MMIQTYLQTTWQRYQSSLRSDLGTFSELCVGAEALRGLSIHLCLALASESTAATSVGLNNAESLELLESVANQTAGRLRAAVRLHAAALAPAVNLSELTGSDPPSDVNLARNRSCSDDAWYRKG